MPDIFIEPHEHPRPVQKPETIQEKQTVQQPQPLKTHRLSLFSSFVRDPYGLALAEQHDDEHILLFIRRSFVTNIPWIVAAGFLLIIPFFIPMFLEPLHLPLTIFDPLTRMIVMLFYYILLLGYMFINFITWFYDIGIVTEKRAVDIDFYNISFVSVATARVQDLKDVRYAQKGFFESLFDYGDVTLSVEASGETLVYENTPHPAEVVSMLSVLIGGHQA